MKGKTVFLTSLLGVLAIAAGLAFFKREALYLDYINARTDKVSIADHIAFMRDGVSIQLPPSGVAPYPVVMQLHGCAGLRTSFHQPWAQIALDAGYAVVLVNSTAPRGISREAALASICVGEKLIGQERAGDILAAIKIADEHGDLDTSRLVLAGWSHGAWTAMDFLTMDFKGRWPSGLRHEAVDVPNVDGVILFYPYCGTGALSRFRQWVEAPPTLALIAGADTIVNAHECIALLGQAEKNGAALDMTVYPGAEHLFDDPLLEGEYAKWHAPEFHADAIRRYGDFLTGLEISD